MTTYNSGSSNYPLNYDLSPTGATTPTISYLLDQLRDSGTGVVTQSGDTVVALDVNSTYTIIQKLEETLGIDPAGSVDYGFSTVAERLDYIQGISGLSFLHVSGGTMQGDITMSGSTNISVNSLTSSGLTWTITSGATISSTGVLSLSNSGNFAISATNSILTLSANNLSTAFDNSQLHATNINELSGNTISLLSTSGVSFNNTILASASGIDIGSTGVSFSSIYADSIVSTGLNGAFVFKSGDTITGDITLGSGVSLLAAESGNGTIGTSDYPFSGMYTKTLYASFVSGLSPVTFVSDINVSGVNLNIISGSIVFTNSSGTVDIGTAADPVGTIYADTVTAGTITIDGFVTSSGDSMTGDLTFTSGNSVVLQSGSIYPETSGVGTVGTTGNYFSDVFTNQINGRSVGSLVFNEVTSGTADGVNMTFGLAHTPLSNYAMIFVSGVLLQPTTQYELSGSTILLTGSMYAPTSAPIAGFYIY